MTASDKVLLSFEQKKDVFGRRVGAMMIDYVLLVGVILAADGLLGNEVYQKTLWLWLSICILYYPVLEGRYGTTLGKKIMALRVVGIDLRPCGYRRAAIRFLVRLIDANLLIPIFALFGLLAFYKTPLRQRWGDIAAKTLVVREEDLKEPNQPPEPRPGCALRWLCNVRQKI
jgi:uncharacterized RDD family membrane protein YckC